MTLFIAGCRMRVPLEAITHCGLVSALLLRGFFFAAETNGDAAATCNPTTTPNTLD